MEKDLIIILKQLLLAKKSQNEYYKEITIDENSKNIVLLKFLNSVKSIKIDSLLKNENELYFDDTYLKPEFKHLAEYCKNNYVCFNDGNKYYLYNNLYAYVFEYSVNFYYHKNQDIEHLLLINPDANYYDKELLKKQNTENENEYYIKSKINYEYLKRFFLNNKRINYSVFDKVFEEIYKQ